MKEPIPSPQTLRFPQRLAEPGLAAGAALLAVAVTAVALIFSGRYFLIDDYATYFMPGFREIARQLAEGHFPLLTDRVWNGGALTQEYQFAVFNPVCLALYAVLGGLRDAAAAAATFSLIHIALMASGVFALARLTGCARRHAFLAAVLAPTADWIFFWGAVNWIPALVSLAWLTWAWALMILAARRTRYVPAAAVAVALTLTSGWPFADLALGLSILVSARVLLAKRGPATWRATARVGVATLAGGLMATPALITLALYVLYAQRPLVSGLWATDLAGLIEVGMPFYPVRWGLFQGGLEPVLQPTVYVAWFAPLVLASADWRRLVKEPAFLTVLACGVAFAAVSMVSHIWLFRWMFRLLPYYQLAVLLLAARALTDADEAGTAWRFDRLALVIAIEVWLAFCQASSQALTYLAVAYGIGFLAWVSTRFRVRDARWTAFALTSSVALFWLTLWQASAGGYPRYPNTWAPPESPPPLTEAAAHAGPTRYAIYRLDEADRGPAFWRAFTPGDTALDYPGVSVIGYTSLVSQRFGATFCEGHFGPTCEDIVARLTAPVTPTGRSMLDLMAVNEVDVQTAAARAAFAAAAGQDWRGVPGEAGGWRFLRDRPEGLVTWTSPGVTAAPIAQAPARIVLQASNQGPAAGRLVIARAWYPGWSARLDGRPVRARPAAGLILSVDLPPASRGVLTVSFWPAGLTLGLVLAALGAVLTILAGAFPRLLDGPLAEAVRSDAG